MSNSIGVARLRNSFSVASINYFDQFQPVSPVPVQEKKKTFKDFKNSLELLNQRVQNAKNKLGNQKIRMTKNRTVCPVSLAKPK